MSDRVFNVEAIGPFLQTLFDVRHLAIFCYDDFPSAYRHFARDMGRLVRFQVLLDWCQWHGEIDQLLARLEQTYPILYQQALPAILTQPPTQPQAAMSADPRSGRTRLELTLPMDLTRFSTEQRSAAVAAAVGAVAGVLQIPPNQINVLQVQLGSTILHVDMPTEAAERLLTIDPADPLLVDLGLTRVQRLDDTPPPPEPTAPAGVQQSATATAGGQNQDIFQTAISGSISGGVSIGKVVAETIEGDAIGGDKVTGDKVQGDKIIKHYYPAGYEALWVGVPGRPTHFVGRELLLADLIARLTAGESLALSAEGKAGVGKTTMAVVLVHDPAILGHFKDGILWASLGPQSDPTRALATWAEALGQDISGLIEVEDRRQTVSQLIGQRHLLLVIDDAWSFAAAEALRCGGPHCRHLLTTRDKALARQFVGARQSQAIPTLAAEPAFDLLQRLAPEACAADPEAARALAQIVGGLPLALELLGGYLAAPERSLFPDLAKAALAALTDPARRLALAKRPLGGPGQEVSLQATIALSLDGLPEPVVQAFYALGAFAPRPATFSRAAAEVVAETDGATLAVLEAHNLVDLVEPKTGELALHQTLADVARTQRSDKAVARHRAYYRALVDENREDWQRVEAVYGQIRWAWRFVPEVEQSLDLVWAIRIFQIRMGAVYQAIGQPDKALDFYQQALPITREVGDRASEAATLTNMGAVYRASGQPDKALEFFQQALPITREIGDHAGEATVFTNMGLVYRAIGQLDKALDLFQQALSIRHQVGDRVGEATTLTNMGLVYDNLGQPDKALDLFQQALPIRREVGDQVGEATTLSNMGLVYRAIGQPDKALDLFQQALRIIREVGDRVGEAATLSNMGVVYRAIGQPDKALDLYQQALPIIREVDDRVGEATTLTNMGLVYDNLGQPVKALDLYRQALPIRREVGDQAGEATVFTNMALVYQAIGQPDKALDFYQQALYIRRQVGDRVSEATTLINMGLVYDNLSQPDKALDLFQQALPITREVGDQVDEATTLTNMGLVYQAIGQLDKALDLFQQALPIIREVDDRTGEAATLSNMGVVYRAIGQLDKALDLYQQALPIRHEVGDHAGESVTRYNLAMVYRRLGRLAEAVAELRRVVELDRLIQYPDLEDDQATLAQVEAELAAQAKSAD